MLGGVIIQMFSNKIKFKINVKNLPKYYRSAT